MIADSSVLCVVPDDFGECLIKILGCFENTAEADRWVENVGSRKIADDDIYVAPTCEWLYPNGDTSKVSTRYRVDELQRIMDAADRNPEAVQNYKDWKRQQDASAAVKKKAREDRAATVLQSFVRDRAAAHTSEQKMD